MLINKRIFVEKKPGFNIEAFDLLNDLNENLNQALSSLRIILVYDVFNIEETLLPQTLKTVFAEAVSDNVFFDLDLSNQSFLSIEALPGQYDQRADSAMQCIKLLSTGSNAKVTCGKIYIFTGEFDLKKIKNYLINPIESRIKDLTLMEIDVEVQKEPLKSLQGFINLNEEQLKAFLMENSLAMSLNDLKLIKEYFIKENRDPMISELKVLDTYWSDHCRHTTFETHLNNISFDKVLYKEEIEKTFNKYLSRRKELKRENKPLTLMDLATINSRYLKSKGLLNKVEISDEVNACSVFVDVDNNGEIEEWLMMFKNETHNHPTEIEPYGGASTCIGGAIRDPLSGRSYVYQAMRISGSGDIFMPLENTMPGKLSQRVISKKSAAGNSSYGNQIGLPTTFVKEIYDDSYVAKHLELGAVVGAVKASALKREKPLPDDVIILLGGRTGRDGIGGATGSSKTHNDDSLKTSASEVQKGNAPEERKIQRLFRNPECSKLIKKCNDFGAGGVCVAIGELARGLLIDLSKVRCKYTGLNASEIAISESQERMAVVVSFKDAAKFIELAEKENLEAYEVAKVTDNDRMVMIYEGEVVVDLKREFIDSAGYRQKADVQIIDNNETDPFETVSLTKDNILKTLADKNVACQKGLVEMFDASIGATTVLNPFGGKNLLTPSIVSMQKFPIRSGKTSSISTLSYGFIPKLMKYSCFSGAIYSVLLSMAKSVAVGNKVEDLYFSFQEYFERLNQDNYRWGKVLSSLLGAFEVLDFFNLAAIGGKDSMSGSFNDYHVCPTFVSFGCCKGDVNRVISNELKHKDNKLGVFIPLIKNGYPDLKSYKDIFYEIERLNDEIISTYVAEEGGIISALFKSSFGNDLTFNINSNLDLLSLIPGAIIVETENELKHPYYHYLGKVSDDVYRINDIVIEKDEAKTNWFKTFDEIYPRFYIKEKQSFNKVSFKTQKTFKAKNLVDEVRVLIPVFPGTNCEYDMERAFNDANAKTNLLIFRNLNEEMILNSIDELVEGLNNCHILALPGGFSAGDEPDGSAKFIVNILQNSKVKKAIDKLLQRDGLIIGICNGFQALVKSGLLPYGEVKNLKATDATLFKNDINRHIATIANTRVCSNNSPWLNNLEVNSVNAVAISHGEGKFVADDETLKKLYENGQIAFQYCDSEGNLNDLSNVNGSINAIEGIISKDGRILGKMGHIERYSDNTFKNIIGNKKISVFENGVNYFKKEK